MQIPHQLWKNRTNTDFPLIPSNEGVSLPVDQVIESPKGGGVFADIGKTEMTANIKLTATTVREPFFISLPISLKRQASVNPEPSATPDYGAGTFLSLDKPGASPPLIDR